MLPLWSCFDRIARLIARVANCPIIKTDTVTTYKIIAKAKNIATSYANRSLQQYRVVSHSLGL